MEAQNAYFHRLIFSENIINGPFKFLHKLSIMSACTRAVKTSMYLPDHSLFIEDDQGREGNEIIQHGKTLRHLVLIIRKTCKQHIIRHVKPVAHPTDILF